MSAIEPLNEDMENPTEKTNVSLSSLIILMSAEMKSSKALCRSGYFSRLNIRGRIYEDSSCIAGVDEARSEEAWALVRLSRSSTPRQLAILWSYLGWDGFLRAFSPLYVHGDFSHALCASPKALSLLIPSENAVI